MNKKSTSTPHPSMDSNTVKKYFATGTSMIYPFSNKEIGEDESTHTVIRHFRKAIAVLLSAV
jgi:hypothetical protein